MCRLGKKKEDEKNKIIIPVLYTKKEWESMSPMPFYQNVEQDKRQLV